MEVTRFVLIAVDWFIWTVGWILCLPMKVQYSVLRWMNPNLVLSMAHLDKKPKWKNNPTPEYQALKNQHDNAVKNQIRTDKNYREEKKKVTELESQCQDLQSENQNLLAKVSRLKQKNRLQQEMKYMPPEFNDLSADGACFQSRSASTENEQMDLEIQSLNHSLSQKDTESSKQQKRIGSLTTELDDIKQELGLVRDQLVSSKKDTEKMKHYVMQKDEILAQRELEIDSLQKEKDGIAAVLQGVEEEVKALRDRDMQKDGLISQREFEIDSLQKEKDRIAAVLHGVEEDVKAFIQEITNIKNRLQEEITKHEEVDNENKELTLRMNDVEKQKADLISVLNRTETDDDAALRLVETMSLGLRDNNPNIVDLSDQHRPTKLAELMNELYDNQWTDVFSYIEDHWNGDGEFQERQCIQFLLHIVMEVYTFCSNKATLEWTDAINLLLWPTKTEYDDKLVTILKDNRKSNVLEALPHVQKSCFEALQQIQLSDDSGFDIAIEDNVMKEYLNECIRLSWLMVIHDPPVYLQCSRWDSKQQNVRMMDGNQERRKTEINQAVKRNGNDRNRTVKLDSSNRNAGDRHGPDDNGDTAGLVNDIKKRKESTVRQNDISFIDNVETEKQPDSENASVTDKSPNRKEAFVKEYYRPYTKRGEHIEYIVWPVVFLHEGGPLLSKGVAQGCY